MRASDPQRTVREYVNEAHARLQATLAAMPGAPADPAWDRLGHTVCCAWSELLRLEAAHAPRDKVNAQRRRAKALTRRWSLAMGKGEAGRREGVVSMTSGHMRTLNTPHKGTQGER